LLELVSLGIAIGIKMLPLRISFPALIAFAKTRKSIGVPGSLLCFSGFWSVLLAIAGDSWMIFLPKPPGFKSRQFDQCNPSIYLLREVGFWIKGNNTIATNYQNSKWDYL